MLKVYSNGCPKCRMLESELNGKAIPFEHISDMETIMSVARVANLSSLPFGQVDDSYYSFDELIQKIRKGDFAC